MGIESRRQARGDSLGLLSAWRAPKGSAKAILRVGWQREVAPPSQEQQGTGGTFETNGNGCLIAFEQAIQRGVEAAQLLCCHDVSKMIGICTLMIG
jgi:hypothetical protein